MDSKKEKDIKSNEVNKLSQKLNSLTLKGTDSKKILPLEKDSKIYKLKEVVPDDERITSHLMTKLEFSSVKGLRAQQIDSGGPVFTNIPEGMVDSKEIAEKEIFDRRCPLKIIRELNDDKIEEWKCNDLIIPVNYRSYYS